MFESVPTLAGAAQIACGGLLRAKSFRLGFVMDRRPCVPKMFPMSLRCYTLALVRPEYYLVVRHFFGCLSGRGQAYTLLYTRSTTRCNTALLVMI